VKALGADLKIVAVIGKGESGFSASGWRGWAELGKNTQRSISRNQSTSLERIAREGNVSFASTTERRK
jgi:hypothetical protein